MTDEDGLIEVDEHILFNSDGTFNTLESYEEKKEKSDECKYFQHDDLHLAVPLLLYSIIHILMKQQSTVLLVLTMHACFSIVTIVLGLINSQNTISRLRIIVKSGQESELYWCVTILDILCNMIIYYISYKAYKWKNYRMYEHLSRWIFVSFFIQQFQQFDYKINVIMAFIKILTQIYAKVTAQLIKGVVSLPQQF